MSKLRLRALNSQNITTLPNHTNLNTNYLNISWKKFYYFFNIFLKFNNNKIFFKKFNKITNINKSLFYKKQYVYLNNSLNINNNMYKYNKNKLSTIKIINNNNLFYINILVFNFNKVVLKSIKIKKNNKKLHTY